MAEVSSDKRIKYMNELTLGAQFVELTNKCMWNIKCQICSNFSFGNFSWKFSLIHIFPTASNTSPTPVERYQMSASAKVKIASELLFADLIDRQNSSMIMQAIPNLRNLTQTTSSISNFHKQRMMRKNVGTVYVIIRNQTTDIQMI